MWPGTKNGIEAVFKGIYLLDYVDIVGRFGSDQGSRLTVIGVLGKVHTRPARSTNGLCLVVVSLDLYIERGLRVMMVFTHFGKYQIKVS